MPYTKRLGALSALIILLLAVLGCSRLTELANQKANSNTSEPAKSWTGVDLANTDMHVELPGAPKDETPPLPESYKAFFTAMHIYSYDAKDFQSSFTELVPTGKKKTTIKELADTCMAAMKRQLPDLTYTLDVRSETNARVSGAFTKAGKNLEVNGCVAYKKAAPARVWAVLALYPKDSADAKATAQRIIESASFKNSPETCK